MSMSLCPNLISAAMITHWLKATWRAKGLFQPAAVVHRQGKSGKGPKEGSWRQELKRRVQRNVAYCLNPLELFILLSYTSRATFPRMEYFHINYQSRKYPTVFLQGRLMKVFPQLKFIFLSWLSSVSNWWKKKFVCAILTKSNSFPHQPEYPVTTLQMFFEAFFTPTLLTEVPSFVDPENIAMPSIEALFHCYWLAGSYRSIILLLLVGWLPLKHCSIAIGWLTWVVDSSILFWDRLSHCNPSVMVWIKMASTGSYVWILGPQLVELFGKD